MNPAEFFDAILIFAWSDLNAELRSNRYHYATRFAKDIPVFFIQPNNIDECTLVKSTYDNLFFLNIPWNYSNENLKKFISFIKLLDIKNPLTWIYNSDLISWIKTVNAKFNIYHATEAYLSKDFPSDIFAEKTNSRSNLLKTIQYVDLVISVSKGVQDTLIKHNPDSAKFTVLENGCDFKYYKPCEFTLKEKLEKRKHTRTVIYQGNIYDKIDFELLSAVIDALPDYKFIFCGPIILELESNYFNSNIITKPNVTYLGKLSIEQLRIQMHDANVGIIPFVHNDVLIKRSLPLKAFEYLACALPTVSVSIDSLKAYKENFLLADDVTDFVKAIKKAAILSSNKAYCQQILNEAAEHDYDKNISEVYKAIKSLFLDNILTPSKKKRLKILVLYDYHSTFSTPIKDSLEDFKAYSQHDIFYLPASEQPYEQYILASYDVIITHYSVRLSVQSGIYTYNPSLANELRRYQGYKVAWLQDEYDHTNSAIMWMKNINFDLILTCVPEPYIKNVYPVHQLNNTQFISILTGYVTERLQNQSSHIIPLSERKHHIAYRGRCLPYWYGSLGFEKYNIGKQMKLICEKKNIPHDIEVDDAKRIYGDDWYAFLANARVTIGTESGSHIFDFDESISRHVKSVLAENPNISFDEIYAQYLYQFETDKIKMNQVSPKIFEAIALKVGLVLFEGDYSGVVEPHVHYIPLKKDFSNIDEVLQKIDDLDYLENMTDRAYQDIILTKQYDNRRFIAFLDNHFYEHQFRFLRGKALSKLASGDPSLRNTPQKCLWSFNFETESFSMI